MRNAVLLLVLSACEPSFTCPVGAGAPVVFPPRDFVCAPGDAPPCRLSEPREPVEARSVCVREELDGVTLAYVVDSIRVPQAVDRVAIGFDLDGIDSGRGSRGSTCEERQPDFTGSEPEIGGVDNVIEGLVTTFESLMDLSDCPDLSFDGCLDARLREDIRAGALLVAVELTDVDSLEHDPDVGATLFAVRTEDGPLAIDGSADDPAARAATGQTFVIVRPITERGRASILRGRLRARWPSLVLPQSGIGYPDVYERTELEADVTERALSNAVLGGLVRVSVFAEQIAAREPMYGAFARGILEDVADVTPSRSDPRTCEQLSAAYALEAVAASLVP